MVYMASHTSTHGYRLTCIETGKICFESLVICIIFIVSHFGLHRLIPKLHGSLSMLTKMADDLQYKKLEALVCNLKRILAVSIRVRP